MSITSDLNTVERYDPRMDKWCMVAPMIRKRSLTAAVTVQGCIYVPGGQYLISLLDTVECYDPRNNTWESMSSLLSSRLEKLANCSDFRLKLGNFGSFQANPKWVQSIIFHYYLVDEVGCRYGCGAGVLDGQMYIAGGCDGTHRLSSLERYDPIRNTWHTMEPMSDQRHSVGIAAL